MNTAEIQPVNDLVVAIGKARRVYVWSNWMEGDGCYFKVSKAEALAVVGSDMFAGKGARFYVNECGELHIG
jgi:hypothetical protein